MASLLMKIRHRSRRGAVTLPARWLIEVRCRGRPRRRLPAPQRCRHHGDRRRPHVTRMWARARNKQLALPENTSGRSAPARSPAGRAPLGRRVPRPAKLTPRGGRRSGRLPPANSMMVPTAPTPTLCRGAGRGRSRQTLRRRRARRRQWILAPPRGVCSRFLSRAAEPRMFTFPSSPAGAKDQPQRSQRLMDQHPSERGSTLLTLRQRVEAEQPSSQRARSVQPPSKARRAARRKSLGCAPRCKFSSSEPLL
jgi:hypothetical protein